jgi:hypothetical protein
MFIMRWSLVKSELPIDTQPDSTKHHSIAQELGGMLNSSVPTYSTHLPREIHRTIQYRIRTNLH